MAYLIRHFSAILTDKVLFDNHNGAMEAADYDLEVAACRVLGQKIATMAEKDTRTFVLKLLNDELKEQTDSTLVREIAEHMEAAGKDRTYRLLDSLRVGLSEVAE